MFSTSSDLIPQVIREQRDRFRFQSRKIRNEFFFSQFRSDCLQKSKKFICSNLPSCNFSANEFESLCKPILISYEQSDFPSMCLNLKKLKVSLNCNNFSSEERKLAQFGIYPILNEIISGQLDTSLYPELLENSLYIYIMIIELGVEDSEALISIEIIKHLLFLVASCQMNEIMFLVFEALASSCSCVNDFFRDFIIKGDIVSKILDVLMGEVWLADDRLIPSIVDLIKSLYSIKPLPPYEEMIYLLDPLITLLEIKNEDLVNDIMFILARMASSNYTEFVNNSLENAKFLEILSQFLRSEQDSYIDSALNITAALTFGNYEQTFKLYEKEIIKELLYLLEKKKNDKNFIAKILVIFGNFFDGETRHVEVGLRAGGIFEYFFNMSEDYDIQREIIQCFVNVSFVANDDQINELVNMGVLKKLKQILVRNECEGELTIVILHGMDNIIRNRYCDYNKNRFYKEWEELNLKGMLEKLLSHYNENIALNASLLLELCN